MGILQLLADMMMFVLKAPFVLMKFVYQISTQRFMTEKALTGVKGELKSVSGLAKFFGYVGRLVLWLLILAFCIGVLVLLWYLNDLLNLERILGGPWPMLRPYWLPLLLVLFCISCLVGYNLYRSLGPDRDIIEFEDITEAWIKAKAALIEAGIDLASVPMFLVLGRTANSLHALLSASRLSFSVEQVPLQPNAPLQVYANRQAIYVVVPDACLLGRQAELLFATVEAEEPQPNKKGSASVFEEPEESPDADAPATEKVVVQELDPLLATQNLLADPGGVAVMTDPTAAQTETMPWELAGHRRMPALLKRTEEVDKYRRRLRFVARQIVRDRAPYCPFNGVMLLIPFEALENGEDASQIASLCQGDLQVLHDTAHVSCPVVILMTDLEKAPGYAGLGESLDPARKIRLFGQELPLLPDLKPDELPRMIEASLRHFGEAVTHWFFRLFRVEKSEKESSANVIKNNSQLFALMGAIRQRETALERILTRILTSEPSLEFLLGGYYLAATGANPQRDQAFVPGVFQHLMQHQNAVSWTAEALTEEADYKRWTTYGYAALGLFCIAVILIVWARLQLLRWH